MRPALLLPTIIVSPSMPSRLFCLLPCQFVLCLLCISVRADEVNFRRDILPVLSDKCFSCHGPDESQRAADFRLDVEALAKNEELAAIVPGDASASELIRRISSPDADDLMPPPDSHRAPLTNEEVETFRRWINEGAPWQKHWSFEKPVRAPVNQSEFDNPIDYFVAARLSKSGLTASAPAAWSTLARRLALDLTGITTDSPLVSALERNPSEARYRQLVEALLASPHFGERMAMWWLDAARYADTDGYQQDATRNNWPWRDWVVDAFNQNLPFDQFTVEQFAGDLLPDSTAEQVLATCFHRNHMSNGEGGRHPEESRVDYVIDRVNTTGTVWLGLTIGCSQCHSHKFDPISQHDYYRMSAFFNSIDEDGKAGAGAKPFMKYESPAASRAVAEAEIVVNGRKPFLDAARKRAELEFRDWLQDQCATSPDTYRTWTPIVPSRLKSAEGTRFRKEDDGYVQTYGPVPFQDDYWITLNSENSKGERISGFRLEVLPAANHTQGKLSRGKTGEFILTDVKAQIRRTGQSQVRDIEIATAVADVEKNVSGRNYGKIRDTLDDDPRNGWTTETHDAHSPHVAVFAFDQPLKLRADEELTIVLLQRSTYGDSNIGRFRISLTAESNSVLNTVTETPLQLLSNLNPRAASDVPSDLRKRLLDQFLSEHLEFQYAKSQLDSAQQQLSEFKKLSGSLNVTVLAEKQQPRTSYVLTRGIWDQHGDTVQPGVPEAILPLPTPESASRLELARWLVSKDNPLTARVIVNQLWQMCFTQGLVRTPEDFGLQGEQPTHPKLLDWLAVEFMESGWDVKHILRLIVTSDTYRQSSLDPSQEKLAADPENRYLARMSRSRLPAWMIRDNALKVSGLLNPALGGPPMRPYQPDGVWAEMFMGRFRYRPSQGSVQFRRTLYAFWRRSAAPTFLFDSSQRRVCEVRPRLTNTPLQALTLLNDVSFLESAREIARQAYADSDAGKKDAHATASKTQWLMFERILGRAPAQAELAVMHDTFEQALAVYRTSPESAKEFLTFGQPETQVQENFVTLAACTVVASLILNLDEAITRE